MGSPDFEFSIPFYTHRGIIRLTSCRCGIARIHAPIAFYAQLASISLTGSPEVLLSIVFYTRWVHIKVGNRFCGSVHIYSGSVVECRPVSAIISDLGSLSECHAYPPRWTI